LGLNKCRLQNLRNEEHINRLQAGMLRLLIY